MLGIGMHRPVEKGSRDPLSDPADRGRERHDRAAAPASRVADLAPKSQLYRSRGGHYGPYKGGKDHDNVIRVELDPQPRGENRSSI